MPTQAGASFPLDFSLHNGARERVLFSMGGPQALSLEITNTSRGDLVLPALESAVATEDHHHLALHLSPGTVTDVDSITLTTESQAAWSLMTDAANHVLYLLRTERETVAPSQSATPVKLENVVGDDRVGSHGADLVLRYQGLSMAGAPIEGERRHRLSVLHSYPADLGRLDEALAKAATPNDLTLDSLEAGIKGNIEYLIKLRDQIAPAMTVDVVGGWDLAIREGKTPLKLRLKPNRHFEQPGADFSLKLTPDTKILLYSDDPELEVSELEATKVGGGKHGNWEPITASNELRGAKMGLKPRVAIPLPVTGHANFAVTVQASGPARVTALRLRCQKVTKVENGKTTPLEDFTLRVPIRVGPLGVVGMEPGKPGSFLVRPARVGIGTASSQPKARLEVEGTEEPLVILNQTDPKASWIRFDRGGESKGAVSYDPRLHEMRVAASGDMAGAISMNHAGFVRVKSQLLIESGRIFKSPRSWVELAYEGNATGLLPQEDSTGFLGKAGRSWGDLWVSSARVDKLGIGLSSSTRPKLSLAIGDSDTGLQGAGDGELAVYTNGSERARFGKDGKLRIRPPSGGNGLWINDDAIQRENNKMLNLQWWGGDLNLCYGGGKVTLSKSTVVDSRGIKIESRVVDNIRIKIGSTSIDRTELKFGSKGSYYATATAEKVRIVRGHVKGSGKSSSGTGFKANGNRVTFSPTFSDTPAVTITPVGAPEAWHCSTAGVSSSGFKYNSWRQDGNGQDIAVDFIAIGPR